MRPLGRGAASLAGALAFVAILAGVLVSGSSRGDFRVDEAHKISETAFLRLWTRGDVRNPAWFANIVDRTNPPVGKYAFGAAILLTGQALPPLPTLAVRDERMPALHTEALSAPYRPLLRAARSVSTLATALTAALLTAILARYHGWLSATAAFGFFALHFLTRSFWASAVFDPLFALFFAMSVAIMAVLASTPTTRRIAVAGTSMGIVAALAFQTRLNGLFAFLIAVPFLWMALRRTIPKAIFATTLATVGFVATMLAVNPFYWSTPATPLEPFSAHDGAMRPIERLLQQKHDLETLATPLQEGRSEARTIGGKLLYGFEIVSGRLPGVLMVIGAMTGVILLGARWRSLDSALRVALLMSLTIVVTMVVTLPMPWPRYLLVIVAPLALVGGFGTAEVLGAFIRELRRAVGAAHR